MKGIVRVVFVAICLAVSWHTVNPQYFPIQSQRCLNPNQRPGTCVSIYDCQTVWSVLQRKPLQPHDIQFVRESECQGNFNNPGQRPLVCCSSDTGFTRSLSSATSPQPENTEPDDYFWGEAPGTGWFFPMDRGIQQGNNNPSTFPASTPTAFVSQQNGNKGNNGRRRRPKIPERPTVTNTNGDRSKLLPQPPACGGVSVTNRIYGGQDADLFEFPWMVMFEYKRFSGDTSVNCAGTLISDRYVLTAAHCVTGSIEKRIGSLASIRLGEHDTSSVVDCNQFTCSPDAYRVGIEEVIPHENYVDSSPNKENDIALVRLDRRIHFSNAVRPICLPAAVKGKRSATITGSLTVAGWGRTLNGTNSAIKQKLNVTLYDQKKCKRKFQELKVNIVDNQVCAGGKFAEDSCEGDSGGPLMRFDSAWILEGIVSFGRKCGLTNWPAVHTRVAAYENWINQKVRS